MVANSWLDSVQMLSRVRVWAADEAESWARVWENSMAELS